MVLGCVMSTDAASTRPNFTEQAANLVEKWHQEYFGLKISDVAIGELVRRIASMAARCREEIFTCIRCEQNYTVPAGTTACPVCDWSHESAIRQQEFDTL